jgi:Flp pilus assembly protein TadG
MTIQKHNQRGASLVEFSIGATVFLMAMFAVIEFGRALWTHNALADAARRGARYAVVNEQADIDDVKRVVVYGNPAGGTAPVVSNLTTDNVDVNYTGFGLDVGTVQVTIKEYDFKFSIPLVSKKITMPKYTTTLTGESAGTLPENIPGL